MHRAKSQRVANALSQVEAEYKVEEFDVTAIEAAEEEREAEIDEDEEAARAADWDEVSGRVAREGVHASWVEAGAAQTAVRRTATFSASGCARRRGSCLVRSTLAATCADSVTVLSLCLPRPAQRPMRWRHISGRWSEHRRRSASARRPTGAGARCGPCLAVYGLPALSYSRAVFREMAEL